MKNLLAGLLLLFGIMTAQAQKIVKLWENEPPTSNEISAQESIDANYWITQVSSPNLSIYLPEKNNATGKVVVICPGGGYAGLASHHEGILFAEWLNQQGIAAFILKYRMPNKHKEVPLDDAQQAIRHVREHADEYGVLPNKIGIAGFSAGGHLAATASTHFATEGTSTRPDFSILYYPVITMDTATHGGSRNNLLGENPSVTDIYIFSNEKQVNASTPPAILFHSDDDKAVLPENSIRYYQALKANDIKASLYIFPEGGHGWGLRENFKYHEQMTALLAAWLKDI